MRSVVVIFFSIIVIVLSATLLAAETELLCIKNFPEKELSKIIPRKVIFRGEQYLFFNGEKKDIGLLEKSGIPCIIIDRWENGFRYFAKIKNSICAPAFSLPSVTVLFDAESFSIIKCTTGQASQLIDDYSCTELIPVAESISHENTVYNFNSSSTDSAEIANIISHIHKDSIRKYIQGLQDFTTRYAYHGNRDTVSEWIQKQYMQFGYTDVRLDSNSGGGFIHRNVIATFPGTDYPGEVIMLGGHYDSYAQFNYMVAAPGADDDGSGTVTVMEIARILKQINYKPKRTIKFVAFACEEQGMYGSLGLAEYCSQIGMDIKLLINFDMVGNSSLPANQSTIRIMSPQKKFYTLGDTLAKMFTPLKTKIFVGAGPDDMAFSQKGYSTLYYFEDDFSPYYHSPQDLVENLNLDYCREVARASCATMISVINQVSEIKNILVRNRGNGNSVVCSWNRNWGIDGHHYRVYTGTSSGNYFRSENTSDTVSEQGGLVPGTEYFIGVAAVDEYGRESGIVETSIIPSIIPDEVDFTADPMKNKVTLHWPPARTLDVTGYNIYRADSLSGVYQKLNSNIVTDTAYTDIPPLTNSYVWYKVNAVDSSNFESATPPKRSHAVTLHNGILFVDDNVAGAGNLVGYTEEAIDNFYANAYGRFKVKKYDIASEGNISLSDFGAYSTVVWVSDNTSSSFEFAAKREIAKYLDYGGNFLYAGLRPSISFEQNRQLQTTFQSGAFIFDYLKVICSQNKMGARCSGSLPAFSEYPTLFVDSLKTQSSMFQLANIEKLQPNGDGTVIYKYNSLSDSSTTAGGLKGAPIGISYSGQSYKAVVFSLPLFFLRQVDAKNFFEYVLVNNFSEPLGVKTYNSGIPDDYFLLQNYPNPFNPTTNIVYSILIGGKTSLKVFDILGNEISTLVDNFQSPGRYTVGFYAGDLPSGVYFYRLKSGDRKVLTGKMVLIK